MVTAMQAQIAALTLIASAIGKFQVATVPEAAMLSAALAEAAEDKLAPVARVVLPASVARAVAVVAVAAGERNCAIRNSGETHDLG